MKLALRLTIVEVETEEDLKTDAAGGATKELLFLPYVSNRIGGYHERHRLLQRYENGIDSMES